MGLVWLDFNIIWYVPLVLSVNWYARLTSHRRNYVVKNAIGNWILMCSLTLSQFL